MDILFYKLYKKTIKAIILSRLYKKIWKDETRIDKIVRKEDKILNGLKKALFL